MFFGFSEKKIFFDYYSSDNHLKLGNQILNFHSLEKKRYSENSTYILFFGILARRPEPKKTQKTKKKLEFTTNTSSI